MVVPPEQTVVAVADVVTLGNAFTVINLVDVFVQPVKVFVPVTVYVVVVVGDTLIDVPVNEPGIHTYELAPFAVIVVNVPAHILVAVAVVETEGNAFTVTRFEATLAVLVHPFVVCVT